MGRRTLKLRPLRNLSQQQLRIARPPFEAEGPRHAFKRAVEALGPFPATTKFEFKLTRKDADRYCEQIGEKYFYNLVEEQTAPRLSEILDHLDSMKRLSKQLSSLLAHLSYAERYLLERLWGIYPPERQDYLNRLLDELGDYGPPGTEDISDDGTLAPGLLAKTLNQLHEYAGSLLYLTNRRYTPPGKPNIDSGGPTNASNIFAPNPRWQLIAGCSEVFCETLGRKFEAEDGTSFQEFVVAIHEWVTGEKDISLVAPLRKYRALRMERDNMAARLNAIAKSCGFTPEQFKAVISGRRDGRIKRHVRAEATEIVAQIASLEDVLTHGNRIPARDIVTG